MFGKKKNSAYADGLFKNVQEIFTSSAEHGSYGKCEIKDGAVYIDFTVAAKAQWDKLLKPEAKARLKGEPLKDGDKAELLDLSVKLVKDGDDFVFNTKDLVCKFRERFEVFSKEENKILEVQSERMLDYKRILNAACEAAELDPLKSRIKFVPADVIDLRVLVNSANVALGDIDISGLDDLTYCFAIYNQNQVQENKRIDFDGIEKWDTSHVKSMLGMFAGCVNFNKDISVWDTSNVKNMDVMFASCKNFNQDISALNTANVESMKGIFYKASSFNQDLSAWDVSKVKDLSYAFFKAKDFDQDLSAWDTSALKNDENMFLECPHMTDHAKHPKLPSEDFKMKYYREHVMTKSASERRAEFKKRLALILCFIIVILVFGLMNQPQA